jgi:RNA polymerase-interacting CarD/CdnL/TRCF family regulator
MEENQVMAKDKHQYSLGDRIVHRNYGVGEIDSVELKTINGVKSECFMVRTDVGTYWFPTEQINNPRIHEVASEDRIQQAIAILKSDPKNMDEDHLQWKKRIDEIQSNGDFLATSRIIRDLNGLKVRKKLNRTQDQALKNMKERLLREWAASANVEKNTIRPKLDAALDVSKHHPQDTT